MASHFFILIANKFDSIFVANKIDKNCPLSVTDFLKNQ